MTRHEELVQFGRQIVQAAPQAYFDVDVEADGPAGIGSLLSIGAVDPFGNKFYIELRPTDKPGTPSSRAFCEAHGLGRERLLKEGVVPRKALLQFGQWVEECRNGKQAVLVAFPSWYDFSHVDSAMIENGLPNPFGLSGYCTQSMALALGLMKDPAIHYDWRTVSRTALIPELIPPREFTHHALEDAIFQQEMHFAMVGYLAERRD